MVAAAPILAEQLSHYGDGDALWNPEPRDGEEVHIFDVGHIDEEGCFSRLFNVSKPADDPLNDSGVPEAFNPLHINKRLFHRVPHHRPPGQLTSTSVTASEVGGHAGAAVSSVGGLNIELKVSCSSSVGALMNLQDTSNKEYSVRATEVHKYIWANHDRWYEYAIGPQYGVDCRPEEIVLVKGTVKTSMWAVAAYKGGVRNQHSASFSGQLGPVGSAGFSFSGTDDQNAYFDWRAGPRGVTATPSTTPSAAAKGKGRLDTSVAPANASDSVTSLFGNNSNQCIFLSYYKIKRRIWIMKKIVANAGPEDLGHDEDDDTIVTNDTEIQVVPEIQPIRMPLDILLDYILEHSDADAAIASHDDISALFPGEHWPENLDVWLADNQPEITVDENKAGYLSIEAALVRSRTQNLESAVMKQDALEQKEKEAYETVLQRAILNSLTDNMQLADPAAGTAEDAQAGAAEGPSDAFIDVSDEDERLDSSDVLRRDDLHGRQYGSCVEQEGTVVVGSRADNKLIKYPHMMLSDSAAEGASVTSVTISAYTPEHGHRLATTCEDYAVRVWDLETGALLMKLDGHKETTWAAAFSPDCTKLLSGGGDNLGILWDLESHAQITQLPGHSLDVWLCQYAPNGKYMATGCVDCIVKIWDGETGELHKTLAGHTAIVMDMRFSPDSTRLASCADNIGYIWNVADGTLLSRMEAHSGVIWSLVYSPDGARIVTGAEDNTARVWSAEDGTELVILREHTGPVWSAVFSPDGNEIATGSYDQSVSLCDSFSGERHHFFGDRPASVNQVAYSADGEFVAGACSDGGVKLWEAKSGKFVGEFQGHKDKVKTVVFTPDDNNIVSSADDGTVRIWNIVDLLSL